MEQNTSLYHHGIKGQRWGVRRFQNKNGTLTRAGRKRYAKDSDTEKPKLTPEQEREIKKSQVLESRSAKTLYENRKMFNYDEMSRAHKLLKVDDDVKKLIVEEPNKVKKFLTEAGDYAEKEKNIVTPVVGTLKELEKLAGDSAKDAQTKDGKSKDSSNDNQGTGGGVKSTKSGKRETTKTDDHIRVDNDVDFSPYVDDYTSSSKTTTSFVASITGSTKVSSLPVLSSETKAFLTENKIAGYLPGPKEDD
jgi:hypothetical protein